MSNGVTVGSRIYDSSGDYVVPTGPSFLADLERALTLSAGSHGRREVAFEVDVDARGRGYGRALATAARHLIPEDRPGVGAVQSRQRVEPPDAPGRRLRPVGSDLLLMPRGAG